MRELAEHEIQQVSGGAAAFSPVPHDAGMGALVAPWTLPAGSPLGIALTVLPSPVTLDERTAGS